MVLLMLMFMFCNVRNVQKKLISEGQIGGANSDNEFARAAHVRVLAGVGMDAGWGGVNAGSLGGRGSDYVCYEEGRRPQLWRLVRGFYPIHLPGTPQQLKTLFPPCVQRPVISVLRLGWGGWLSSNQGSFVRQGSKTIFNRAA